MTNNEFKVKLSNPNSVIPVKNNPSDSGYDLTLITLNKTMDKVQLYGTGVHVKAPDGFYFDLVPRSSIFKSGYMLANSIGIIDNGYTGEIMVALTKFDSSKPDLKLPARLVQLIPRKVHDLKVTVCNELDETDRSDKGFGSSGN